MTWVDYHANRKDKFDYRFAVVLAIKWFFFTKLIGLNHLKQILNQLIEGEVYTLDYSACA